MKIYNKLVRDNIPEIMIKNGAKPVTRILSDEEYLSELNKKLLEEVNEYLESEDVLEIADIEEVLLAILKTKRVSLEDFNELRIDKVNKRGAFDKKIFLEKEE
ncbi:MAG: nucleoside triphosphate pyrophosphohydrolase [Bacilli bacterium]|nr:nucleoside triphosphate pyrophosphohydrolase [Bacilli bacterium]MBQ8901905.1 nucleoside triphosphate pyrophosphohydrolase [Bacilli bacterium]